MLVVYEKAHGTGGSMCDKCRRVVLVCIAATAGRTYAYGDCDHWLDDISPARASD